AGVGTAEAGAFGPAPVMPKSPAGPPGFVPEPRDAPPYDTVPPASGHRPGKLSVSVAATAAPGPNGRGRRVGCAVALSIAGALAVVTLVPVWLYWLQPDGKGTDSSAGTIPTSSSPSASASTSTSTSTSTASSVPSAGDGSSLQSVPDAYLGTWQGEGTALGGTLPDGTFRITIAKVGVGQRLGILRQTDQLGGVCDDVLTLKQVTKTRLVASAAGATSNRDVCNQAAHTVTLTPVGDDLKYVSDSSAEGSPTARLSKVK
ncbi:serine/threonine protein kinase, partial [Streptomyces sp. NPDC058469]